MVPTKPDPIIETLFLIQLFSFYFYTILSKKFFISQKKCRGKKCLPEGIKQVRLLSDTAGYQHNLLKYCATGDNGRFGENAALWWMMSLGLDLPR